MSKRLLVTVSLDDIDTDELIDELECRYLSDREKKILLDIVGDNDPKLKLFMQFKDRFSLMELEQLLKEEGYAAPVPIPQNQLKLI